MASPGSLYNRQVYAIGEDTQAQLARASVLVLGLDATGCEVAKNLILMGLGAVTLCDGSAPYAAHDDERPFVARDPLCDAHATTRAAQLAPALQALNPFVRVAVLDSPPLAASDLAPFSALLACGPLWRPHWPQLHTHARHLRVPLIVTAVTASHAFVCSDFGDAHHVSDAAGERPAAGELSAVGADDAGLLLADTDEPHGLCEGDAVTVTVGGESAVCAVARVLSATTAQLRGAPPALTRPGARAQFVQLPATLTVCHAPLVHHLPAIAALGPIMERAPPAAAQLCGAVAAHEALKAGGKFTPLAGLWAHPLPRATAAGADVAPSAARPVLAGARVLVVGAGAVGCEMLKTLAELHCAEIVVTDPDSIDVSNLSRQLLYRAGDVGRGKAATAAREIGARFGGTRVTAHEVALAPASPGPEALWRVAAVMCCVDNIAARLHVDAECVRRGLALFDCGTLGAKGNTQCVTPGQCEPYGASADVENQPVAQCTLHLFPTRVEHIVEHARHAFHRHYTRDTALCVAGAVPPGLSAAEHAECETALRELRALHTADDCVRWAQQLFARTFGDAIEAVLARHPPGSVTEGGLPFWAPPRRLPRPLSAADAGPLYAPFVAVAAQLRAQTLGIGTGSGATPVAYDKDGDARHLTWLTLHANLRGQCYGIAAVSELEARRISGRIVPAMVTSTAAVAALAAMQLCLHVAGAPVAEHRNTYVNLNLGLVCDAEPMPPAQRVLRPGWTVTPWDCIDVAGPCSLRQLLDTLEQRHRVIPEGLSVGAKPLWSSFAAVDDDQLDCEVAALVRRTAPEAAPADARWVWLELTGEVEDAEDKDGDAPDLPLVRYALHGANGSGGSDSK